MKHLSRSICESTLISLIRKTRLRVLLNTSFFCVSLYCSNRPSSCWYCTMYYVAVLAASCWENELMGFCRQISTKPQTDSARQLVWCSMLEDGMNPFRNLKSIIYWRAKFTVESWRIESTSAEHWAFVWMPNEGKSPTIERGYLFALCLVRASLFSPPPFPANEQELKTRTCIFSTLAAVLYQLLWLQSRNHSRTDFSYAFTHVDIHSLTYSFAHPSIKESTS